MKMGQRQGEAERLQRPVERLGGGVTKGGVDVGVADLVAQLGQLTDGQIFFEGGGGFREPPQAEEDVA